MTKPEDKWAQELNREHNLWRQREVDAAVREGLDRWSRTWDAHPFDPELVGYVTKYGESHKAVSFIRQAWREQHA